MLRVVDGMLEPEQVADAVIETLDQERFLVLPHPEVLTYMQRKTADYDRWLVGMRRLAEQYPPLTNQLLTTQPEGTMGTTIHGYCHDKFERVREAFAANFADGSDLGASFAATVDGEFVVDIWAGHLDEEKKTPWKEDTIVNVYSTTKTMAAISALVLADRGEIDFYEKVSKYWPEFAQNGKGDVEVRHFMSHSAGLSGMDGPVTTADVYDWDKMCAHARGAGAVVETRNAERLSRDHAGLSDRRSRSPRHRHVARHVLPQGNRRTDRRRFPHRPRPAPFPPRWQSDSAAERRRAGREPATPRRSPRARSAIRR